jgi:hypothetical protein
MIRRKSLARRGCRICCLSCSCCPHAAARTGRSTQRSGGYTKCAAGGSQGPAGHFFRGRLHFRCVLALVLVGGHDGRWETPSVAHDDALVACPLADHGCGGGSCHLTSVAARRSGCPYGFRARTTQNELGGGRHRPAGELHAASAVVGRLRQEPCDGACWQPRAQPVPIIGCELDGAASPLLRDERCPAVPTGVREKVVSCQDQFRR